MKKHYIEAKEFTIPFETLARRVRLDLAPDMEGSLRGLLETALKIARPRGIWMTTYIEKRDDQGFSSGGERFSSSLAARNVAAVHRIFPYLVTCGPEFDEMELPGTDMLEGFWLDEIKELALGAALKAVRTDLRTTHKTTTIHSMNPGSGNIDVWPIEEQRPLFRLIGEDAQRWSGVTLTDSLLMVPNKSISGFFFTGTSNYESCAYCDRHDCPDRRAPRLRAKKA
ncbi:vitamin B12 dependent-methionine synthase activation domain-containing protein [Sediminispirochaeta bajacaliforniensis]|uniref:vitamin B12 dependent-methionine synthase activation domain-containing protein n=1 Tax=Sediminispirochaeta bajacaliforniensis TaxID=148 RepID=UPI0003604B78|nr:vitamin B12 dependent-methionine synthase activation domain-containing protein [Sediminispirochaeta bajacaliforniensis]